MTTGKKYVFLNSALKKTDTHRKLGTPGYTPMPLDVPIDQFTNEQLVADIRHYMTVSEQKKQMFEQRQERQRALNILHKTHDSQTRRSGDLK